VPRQSASPGSNPIQFIVESVGEPPIRIVEKTTFVVQ
jgi:hypothetical protein